MSDTPIYDAVKTELNFDPTSRVDRVVVVARKLKPLFDRASDELVALGEV